MTDEFKPIALTQRREGELRALFCNPKPDLPYLEMIQELFNGIDVLRNELWEIKELAASRETMVAQLQRDFHEERNNLTEALVIAKKHILESRQGLRHGESCVCLACHTLDKIDRKANWK